MEQLFCQNVDYIHKKNSYPVVYTDVPSAYNDIATTPVFQLAITQFTKVHMQQ